MFVRKRKAARKKRKQIENSSMAPSMPEEYAGDEEGDAEADRDIPSYADHQFTFATFETVRRALTSIQKNKANLPFV